MTLEELQKRLEAVQKKVQAARIRTQKCIESNNIILNKQNSVSST